MNNILLIDDSATARLSTLNLLKGTDYHTIVAENGMDALNQVIVTRPHLILLDLAMPVWHGLMVLSLLKNNPETAMIPVVILSGRDGICDKSKAMILGAVDFLVKPCAKEALLKTLKQHCSVKITSVNA